MYGASRHVLADQVTRTVRSGRLLQVDWVSSQSVAPGRLGLTLCPGRRDRGRDLDADLAGLLSEGVARLLCLSTDSELEWAGVSELDSRARMVGLDYRSLAVPDHGTPEQSEAVELVRWCREATRRGESVVVTCMGGLAPAAQ